MLVPTSVVHLARGWEDCKMDLEENAILISSTETFSRSMEGSIPTAIDCEIMYHENEEVIGTFTY